MFDKMARIRRMVLKEWNLVLSNFHGREEEYNLYLEERESLIMDKFQGLNNEESRKRMEAHFSKYKEYISQNTMASTDKANKVKKTIEENKQKRRKIAQEVTKKEKRLAKQEKEKRVNEMREKLGEKQLEKRRDDEDEEVIEAKDEVNPNMQQPLLLAQRDESIPWPVDPKIKDMIKDNFRYKKHAQIKAEEEAKEGLRERRRRAGGFKYSMVRKRYQEEVDLSR